MGDVLDFRRTTKATDKEKADLYLKLLHTCKKYLLYAQHKGVYNNFEIDGQQVANFIDKLEGI